MADHPVGAMFAGLLLFVIGLGVAGGSLEAHRRERERLAGWGHATGLVVELLPAAAGGAARPMVTFTTAGGDRIRFTSVDGGGTRGYKVGDTVPVLYPPSEPVAARIDRPGSRWTRTAMETIGSVALMGLGAYVAWYARRRDTAGRLQ